MINGTKLDQLQVRYICIQMLKFAVNHVTNVNNFKSYSLAETGAPVYSRVMLSAFKTKTTFKVFRLR